MFIEDARRCCDALIGEVEGAGSTQRKMAWMKLGWHRRLTWLRWLRELRTFIEDRETMALARHLENERLKAQIEAAGGSRGDAPAGSSPETEPKESR